MEPGILVSEVRLIGNRHVSSQRIRFLLQVRAGKTYTPHQLQDAYDDDVRAIATMGPFSDPTVEVAQSEDGRSEVVTYRFHELPYVYKVTLQGIGYFDREKAEKVVTTKAGSYLNEVILESDRKAIERVFAERGDRWCRVRVETTQQEGDTEVAFVVELGQQMKVARVDYFGLPQGARPIDLNRALLMPPFEPYQPELVELDSGAVAHRLQDLGWLDAKVVSTRIEIFDYVRPTEERRRHGPDIAPDDLYNDRVAIAYTVVPGPRYKLGKVSFVGNKVATQEELRRAFRLPEGAWFIDEDIRGDGRPNGEKGAIERSRRIISNQGYARCAVHFDRHIDYDRHIVDLVLHVDEGHKYHVGRVDVAGNEHTRDQVVRRALYLNPGDLWNDDRRDESVLQIRRVGVFDSSGTKPPNVETTFPEDRPDQVDLTARVEERSTGSLNFQIGYSTATKIFGQVGYTESNFDLLGLLTGGFDHFRGAGQILQSSIMWSEPQKEVSASWTDPHMFDGPYSLTVSANRIDDTLLEWAERRVSVGATVGRYFLDNRLNLNLGYTYSDIKIDNVQSNAPDDAIPGDFYLQTMTLGQSFDELRPDARMPTRGFILATTEGVTGLILPSSAEYAEYSAHGEGYLPLAQAADGGVTYFHLSANWHQERPFGETSWMPFYQRYRDGGPAPKHRGFDFDELSPQEINHNGALARTGGTKDGLATIEFSVPVQGTNEGIRAIAFVDVGDVWAQNAPVRYEDLRTAFGVGIRFPIQIPVALDFAWLVNPGNNESRTHVQFGMGNISF
jgi:outer membrane protein insertion porin family